jgi:hypothetical protein
VKRCCVGEKVVTIHAEYEPLRKQRAHAEKQFDKCVNHGQAAILHKISVCSQQVGRLVQCADVARMCANSAQDSATVIPSGYFSQTM